MNLSLFDVAQQTNDLGSFFLFIAVSGVNKSKMEYYLILWGVSL